MSTGDLMPYTFQLPDGTICSYVEDVSEYEDDDMYYGTIVSSATDSICEGLGCRDCYLSDPRFDQFHCHEALQSIHPFRLHPPIYRRLHANSTNSRRTS